MLTEGSNCFVGLVFFHQLHKTRVCIDWIFKETSFTYDSVPERGRKDMKSPPNPLAALQAVSLPEEKELMMFLASSILSCPSWTLCLSQAQKLFYQWEELWGSSKQNCFSPRTSKLHLCCPSSDLLNQGEVFVLLL